MRGDLPTGTVTVLFTDIEGSTRLLHRLGSADYAAALAEHRRLLREAFALRGGVEVDTQGDALFAAFPTAEAAAEAAAAGQAALAGGPVAVRMGLHTGTPTVTAEGYVGEDVHRGARVAALAHGGQVLLTDATRALLPAATVVTDLGLHRIKDFPDGARVFQLGPSPFPPLRTPGAVALPVPATPFVGRERELYDAVTAWLERDPRVLTVVGPGGIGKTRFALELARLLGEDADGGTVFVPLAPVRDTELVLPAIAGVLGAPSGDPLDVAARLGVRRAHVVVDNLEQLLPDVARTVAELIAAAPTLRLIVTSREPLRIQGEVELDLEPLDDDDAVTLFVARAIAVRPDVEPTAAVAELCARLDRLPLAIELAAARTKLMTPEQVLDRLDDALDLLRGTREAETRHATLRATIGWSYELLDEVEQRAFSALAVFRGGWRLEVAEDVCGVDVDTVASLLDKSLVRRRDGPDGETRFWMLETIREFASERLAVQPDLEERVRRRHADSVLGIARAAHLSSEDQGRATPDFALALAERDEIRAALAWGIVRDPVLATELVVALEQLWVTSALQEGRRACESLLGKADDLPVDLRARLLRVHGGIVLLLGDRELGERRYHEAIALFRAVGDDRNELALQARFAVHAGFGGDPDEARQLIAEVRRLNADGSPMIEAQMLAASADLARRGGDVETALGLSRASVETASACGFRFWELWQLLTVAELELELGRTRDGSATVERTLELAAALQDRRIARWTASVFARALLDSDPAAAGLVWGAVVEEETRDPQASLDAGFDDETAPLDACVDPRFATGVERGRTMSLDRAVALAQTVP